MAHYLMTGGTGFIGTTLVNRLCERGNSVTIVSRSPRQHSSRFPEQLTKLVSDFGELNPGMHIDGVVNLAGENISDKRWTAAQKKRLIESRTRTTSALIDFIAAMERKPEVMISGSAVGYYGSRDDQRLDEDAEPRREFTHELCRRWEDEARRVEQHGVRLCLIRTAPVLEKHGGMLKKLLLPFRLGLGGRIGSGRQMLSWIHLKDEVDAILFLLDDNECDGPFNLASPNAVSNEHFSKALATALHRPAFLPLPGFAVKLLFGEMGETLLLSGQNVYPRRLLEHGFKFECETIEDAFANIFE